LNNMGTFFIENKDVDGAIDFWKQANENNRNNPLPWLNLAQIYNANGKPAESLKILENGTNQLPNEVGLLLMYAETLSQAQDYQKAIHIVNRVIKLEPKSIDAWTLLSGLYGVVKNTEGVITASRHALSLDPDNPIVMTNLGSALAEKEEYEQALDFLKKAISIKSHPGTWLNLGIVYLELENTIDARKCFEQVINIGDTGRGYFMTAVSFATDAQNVDSVTEKKDSIRKAIEYLEKAIAISQDYKREAEKDTIFDCMKQDSRFKQMIQ